MIKINLASKKQSALSVDDELDEGFGGGNIGKEELAEFFQDRGVRVFLIGIVAVFFANWLVDGMRVEKMNLAQIKLDAATQESLELKKDLVKANKLKQIKEALEKEDFTIRTKIETIEKIVKGRRNSYKMLVSLSQAIPEKVWIESFSIRADAVSFRGGSADYNQISDFMKTINQSVFYKDVELKRTEQQKEKDGVELAVFELSAKREQ